MKLDFFPKSFRYTVKCIVCIYALATIVYASIQLYNITSTPHTRTRRSIMEHQKEWFFVAPLNQETIEDDEESEIRRIIYLDEALSSQTDVEHRRKKKGICLDTRKCKTKYSLQ